ncbi:oxaloacetate decarboxylase [Aliiglaciecola sp. SL4]|uniref:isocitrate lyase/PEP mutase family protein n=1 Tax=Aliiglaciecola sp. SL4 TaxID=3239806 RepID=UPI00355BBC03
MKMNLKTRLAQQELLMAAGVFDALSALLVEEAGFEAAFVSGSAVAYSQLARPDIGLVTLTEMAFALERIRDRVDMYLLVDADSGFGNAFDVQRTVRTFERAGANGIQIEDQLNTKSPKQVAARPVLSTDAMVGKIKAAVDARQKSETVISARSDAVFTLGVEQGLMRAQAFIEAGADMVFVEGIKDPADIQKLTKICGENAPVLYNLINPSLFTPEQLQSFGVSMALYPAVMINSMANSGREAATNLSQKLGLFKGNKPIPEPINNIIGSDKFLQNGYRYDEHS